MFCEGERRCFARCKNCIKTMNACLHYSISLAIFSAITGCLLFFHMESYMEEHQASFLWTYSTYIWAFHCRRLWSVSTSRQSLSSCRQVNMNEQARRLCCCRKFMRLQPSSPSFSFCSCNLQASLPRKER